MKSIAFFFLINELVFGLCWLFVAAGELSLVVMSELLIAVTSLEEHEF